MLSSGASHLLRIVALRSSPPGPGDTLPFELLLETGAPAESLEAELWTNVNHNHAPELFEAWPMVLLDTPEPTKARFGIELPLRAVGNYRAAARVRQVGTGRWTWTGEQHVPDLLFRLRPPELDALEIEEVSVWNANAVGGRPGTFADLMERGSPTTNGRYTLEWLAEQGKNCVWLLPIFEVSEVQRVHPADDLPSPYAVADFFSVRRDLARAARGRRGTDAREAAREEFQAFVRHAHALGLKVLLDFPLNHLGKRHRFADLFEREGRREVRSLDFSNLALTPAQQADVERCLATHGDSCGLELLAPWMFASTAGAPEGARDPSQIPPGGWFEWPDTLQLNHGRRRIGYEQFTDLPSTREQFAVQGWLTRALSYWAVEMDVDGFRFDHLSGIPPRMLEVSFNLVQADADRLRPGKGLILLGEDFDSFGVTRHFLDLVQGCWADDLCRARTPADFEAILEGPLFCHTLGISSHDEDRLFHRVEDPRAALRLGALMHLLGGPVLEVMGDWFGERERLPVRRNVVPEALRRVTPERARLAAAFSRFCLLRRTTPALRGKQRAWLRPRSGGPDDVLLAVARRAPLGGAPVFVFSNLSDTAERSQVFALDADSRPSLRPARWYLARDLAAAGHPRLWQAPKRGDEILAEGLYVRLAPYQIQILELVDV